MLTLLDAVCCAGSRETQNDDMFGFTPRRAFVVDGATDLVDTPFSGAASDARSEEHTSELQSLMRISYAVFCLKKKKRTQHNKAHASVRLHKNNTTSNINI